MKATLFYLFMAAFLVGSGRAATITVGTLHTKSVYPFGTTSSGAGSYLGQYQQIYSKEAFPASVLITQIAFSSYFMDTGRADYTLSIGLGVTSRTPAAPGSTFADGLTAVFFGMVAARFTAERDFDLPIPLAVPFSYDPSQGNLILDVTILEASGRGSGFGNIFDVDTTVGMGRIWTSDGSPLASPNSGLVTQFTVTAVPEPSSYGFLSCALALCLRRGSCMRSRR